MNTTDYVLGCDLIGTVPDPKLAASRAAISAAKGRLVASANATIAAGKKAAATARRVQVKSKNANAASAIKNAAAAADSVIRAGNKLLALAKSNIPSKVVPALQVPPLQTAPPLLRAAPFPTAPPLRAAPFPTAPPLLRAPTPNRPAGAGSLRRNFNPRSAVIGDALSDAQAAFARAQSEVQAASTALDQALADEKSAGYDLYYASRDVDPDTGEVDQAAIDDLSHSLDDAHTAVTTAQSSWDTANTALTNAQNYLNTLMGGADSGGGDFGGGGSGGGGGGGDFGGALDPSQTQPSDGSTDSGGGNIDWPIDHPDSLLEAFSDGGGEGDSFPTDATDLSAFVDVDAGDLFETDDLDQALDEGGGSGDGPSAASFSPGTRVSGKTHVSFGKNKIGDVLTGTVERDHDSGPSSTSCFVRWDDGSGESMNYSELTVLSASGASAPAGAGSTSTYRALKALPGFAKLTDEERAVLVKMIVDFSDGDAAQANADIAGMKTLPVEQQTENLKMLATAATMSFAATPLEKQKQIEKKAAVLAIVGDDFFSDDLGIILGARTSSAPRSAPRSSLAPQSRRVAAPPPRGGLPSGLLTPTVAPVVPPSIDQAPDYSAAQVPAQRGAKSKWWTLWTAGGRLLKAAPRPSVEKEFNFHVSRAAWRAQHGRQVDFGGLLMKDEKHNIVRRIDANGTVIGGDKGNDEPSFLDRMRSVAPLWGWGLGGAAVIGGGVLIVRALRRG